MKALCVNCKLATGNKPKLTWNGPIPNIKWPKKMHCWESGKAIVVKPDNACPGWESEGKRE